MPGNALSMEDGVEKMQHDLAALELEKEAAFTQIDELEKGINKLRADKDKAVTKINAYDKIAAVIGWGVMPTATDAIVARYKKIHDIVEERRAADAEAASQETWVTMGQGGF